MQTPLEMLNLELSRPCLLSGSAKRRGSQESVGAHAWGAARMVYSPSAPSRLNFSEA